MSGVSRSRITSGRSATETELRSKIAALKEGADHDSPLALSPWERDFINQLSRLSANSKSWKPSGQQAKKIVELWSFHFD